MLVETKKEMNISQNRRDYAFGERDRILQESYSIRRQCDELRRDRDRAVSEHAVVLSELDELKKHKHTTFKELSDIR